MPDAPTSELAAFEMAPFELAGAYWPGVERGPRRLLVAPVGDPAGASAAEGRLLLTRLTDSLNAAIEVSVERRRA